MDGNGRWAKQHLLARVAGHRAGIDAAKRAVRCCVEQGIETLSLFAFSSENWRRPTQEVSFLMDLLMTVLTREVDELHKNNIKLRVIGDTTKLNEKLCQAITASQFLTQHNTGLTLVIAVGYGGRWDILQAVKKIAEQVSAGQLQSSEITEDFFSNFLTLSDLPEPDLFIRTSGEQRISNFYLWQIAYTELHFVDVLWPDFTEKHLLEALQVFAKRQRRFGCIASEQV